MIGGVRGSGKTRLLRLLKDRYRKNWAENGPGEPLWISVDLGQRFDPR